MNIVVVTLQVYNCPAKVLNNCFMSAFPLILSACKRNNSSSICSFATAGTSIGPKEIYKRSYTKKKKKRDTCILANM